LANWVRIVRYVGVAALLLLVLQYCLGLWTNVYAPVQFSNFNSGANYSPALNAHIMNGDILFVLGLLAVVFAVFSKRLRLIVPAVVLTLAVFLAGEFGMAFVNATPNAPIDSFAMGVTFLFALFGAGALAGLARAERPPATAAPAATAPGSPAA
jgi:hypothetical protein